MPILLYRQNSWYPDWPSVPQSSWYPDWPSVPQWAVKASMLGLNGILPTTEHFLHLCLPDEWHRLVQTFLFKGKTCVDTHILLWRLSTSSSFPGYLFHFFICFISLCMWFWDGVLLSTYGWLNVHCVARAHLGWPLSMVPKTKKLRD